MIDPFGIFGSLYTGSLVAIDRVLAAEPAKDASLRLNPTARSWIRVTAREPVRISCEVDCESPWLCLWVHLTGFTICVCRRVVPPAGPVGGGAAHPRERGRPEPPRRALLRR